MINREKEASLIAKTGEHPVTKSSMVEELRALGVQEGMTLLVHSSLSSIGWVCGGAIAVVQALLESVGDKGTIMVPTHSSDLSEPSLWRNPPVPESWWPIIRDEMPAFDPDMTPTCYMGAIVDCFRTVPGVIRSSHPQFSFAALGPKAENLIHHHSLDLGLGEESPLARLYELGGYVLLVGVGHERNTSLHLSEYRADYANKEMTEFGSPIMQDGVRKWVNFRDLSLDSDDFEQIGEQFTSELGLVREGRVGIAQALLMPQRELVDFGAGWMTRHR
ncbi:AAC(3) family N-acetyltransferase [Paenibacillus albiflavus]|uniref:Aminoglycoside N(3)-acetyltransferase n=1 Tax=Paenibacillus albiflavus TaxID=2545760 RepID=A0A4R4E0X3_9BACL|nr:AAC(3) family N-acetyltransferase [Paenibacillus albiflavus]TCZ70943.1 AAC(3) family N-acetyltransferase [Paenibacillus albiflavus]